MPVDVSDAGVRRIHELFLNVCARHANEPALFLPSTKMLTFKQLLAESRKVQHALAPLIESGKRDQLVGIYMERTTHFFASIFGALLGGLGYVPVSTKYEEGRIKYILEFSAPVAVLSYVPHSTELSQGAWAGPVLDVATLPDAPAALDREAIRGDASGSGLAYVIFTSGTTGRPKGVMIEHHSVCNLVHAKRDVMNTTHRDRVLQFFDVAFDGSVFDIFPALCTGCSLVLWTGGLDNAVKSAHDNRATVAFFTNSSLEVVSSLPTSMRIIGQAGEALSPLLVNQYAPQARFMNLYGPTEATVWTTWKDLRPGEEITIGVAVPNCLVALMQGTSADTMEHVAKGEIGEIMIGGAGLARGYLKDEERTSKTFAQTKYGRYYHSGDLGQFNAAGDLLFKGRVDDQVKISGVRIELQEIEQVLLTHDAVTSACAVVMEGRVQAYVVVDRAKIATTYRAELIDACKANLPSAAVPSAVYALKEMPVTANGKVDKEKLTRKISVEELGREGAIDAVLEQLACVFKVHTIEFEGKIHTYAQLRKAMPTPKAYLTQFLVLRLTRRDALPDSLRLIAKMPHGELECKVYEAPEILYQLSTHLKDPELYMDCVAYHEYDEGVARGCFIDELDYDDATGAMKVVEGYFTCYHTLGQDRLDHFNENREMRKELFHRSMQKGFHPWL